MQKVRPRALYTALCVSENICFRQQAPLALRYMHSYSAPHGTLYLASPQIFIQKRYFIRPFFRIFRSTFAIAGGAAAGTAAFANYKFQEASNAFGDKFDKIGDWLKSAFDFSADGNPFGDPMDYAYGESETANNTNSNGGSNGNYQNQSHSNPFSDLDMSEISKVSGSGSKNPADDDDDRMVHLTKNMIEIRNILVKVEGSSNVRIPSIVVIGSQSSGKSSVLEAIVGHEFLPKGTNMVTRRPIELTLIRTGEDSNDYCEFPLLRTGKIGFKEVKQILVDLNKAVPDSQVIDEEPINLNIYSPHVPDLTLIDLPGYIQVVAADQPLELKQRISDLCEKYIQAPNVILAVSAADVDLANSTALRASRKADPRGERTIGVISKMDLVDPERGCNTLLTKDYPLKMGYVGVVTKMPTKSLFKYGDNLTSLIAKTERQFFGNSSYESVDWGVVNLRSRLVKVLSRNMLASLEPTINRIQSELEEVSYNFKVQYNDRVLTPETYLAQCSDEFKVNFQEIHKHFGREQVQILIKQLLDQQTLNVLADNYWVDNKLLDDSKDVIKLQGKLESASSALTKSGVGRYATVSLVSEIKHNMEKLKESSCFRNHPLALKLIDEATDKILKAKFSTTSDQIENSIKPYKYEVDIDAREWQQSREYVHLLLKEEISQAKRAYDELKAEIGNKRLNTLMRSLQNLPLNELLNENSPKLVEKVKYASYLKDRVALIKARSVFIQSSKCKTWKNKTICPEIFMDVVSTKLASTAVLFLNFELLSDFYYTFPREFDASMHSLTSDDINALASQDPKIKRHVELQSRKELLQLALSKLRAINDLQKLDSH